MTDLFNWRVNANASQDTRFSMVESRFGDGYVQQAPNGINNHVKKWRVELTGYESRVKPVSDFLDLQNGQIFLWKSPRDTVAVEYRCIQYSYSGENGGWWSLSGEFERMFQ